MNIIVEVNSSEATDFEFAKVNLNYLDQGKCYKLDIDFSTLYKECGKPTSKIMDFLFISSIIYSVDKIVSREDAHDNWTRNLYVEIPVSNLNEWNKVKEDFIEMINFLTGDKWDINFKKLKSNLDRINNDVEYIPLPFTDKEKAVSLFSGGLDSLTGVIDWLENYSERLILVGHYDPQVAGPKSDQQKIYNKIKSHYQDRTRFLQIKLGQRPYPTEGTYRSRSLVF